MGSAVFLTKNGMTMGECGKQKEDGGQHGNHQAQDSKIMLPQLLLIRLWPETAIIVWNELPVSTFLTFDLYFF